jgi:hypothetical protein
MQQSANDLEQNYQQKVEHQKDTGRPGASSTTSTMRVVADERKA